jgi:hypothetical protein
MTTFYRVDGGKLTYAEYWRMAPEPISFLIAAARKFVGLPIQFRFAVPRPDRLFLVDFAELPETARAAMRPLVHKAQAIGLRLGFYHRLALPEPHRVGAAAALLDEDASTCLYVIFGQDREQRQVQTTCASRLADDSLAVTTTMRKMMEPVPTSHVERHPGVDPATLYGRHQEHLEDLESRGLAPLRIDPDRLADFVLEWEVRYVDFHASRGVFVPMTDEELDQLCERRSDGGE